MWLEGKCAAFMLLALIVIVCFSCSTRSDSEGAHAGTTQMREASKWATIAASEKNELLRLLHLNYALVNAKLAAAEDAGDELSAGEVSTFINRVEAMQAESLKAIGSKCPSVRQDVKLAQQAGWV